MTKTAELDPEVEAAAAEDDPQQVAGAVQQVLRDALAKMESGEPDQIELAKAMFHAATIAASNLEKALTEAAAGLGDKIEKVMAGTKRVGVPMPSRYADESPVPLMDPEDNHAFIGKASDPGTCVACGKGLGDDLHWQMAPVYKGEGGEGEDAFAVLPEQGDLPVWVELEKDAGGKALRGLVYGVVLHPAGHDAHGDEVEAPEIEKAAHGWMQRSRQLGDQHFLKAGANVVESYLAPVTFKVTRPDGTTAVVPKGAWVAVTKVEDTKLLRDIVTGKKTGYSIGGTGIREKSKA